MRKAPHVLDIPEALLQSAMIETFPAAYPPRCLNIRDFLSFSVCAPVFITKCDQTDDQFLLKNTLLVGVRPLYELICRNIKSFNLFPGTADTGRTPRQTAACGFKQEVEELQQTAQHWGLLQDPGQRHARAPQEQKHGTQRGGKPPDSLVSGS